MRRIISFLLCVCMLVVCALVARFGQKQMESSSQTKVYQTGQSLKQLTCSQLLEKTPRSLQEFELTGFYPGKQFVGIDENDDGRWERVFVPVFDRPLKDIRRNYRAIVICFAGAPDEVELRKQLNTDALKAQFWPYSQKFKKKTYNALAERYTSLDFNRSIIVHCGFPKSAGIARYLFWGGAGGVLLTLLAMGWQSLGLIAIAIRKSATIEEADDEEEEEESREFLNRAGLPTIKRE